MIIRKPGVDEARNLALGAWNAITRELLIREGFLMILFPISSQHSRCLYSLHHCHPKDPPPPPSPPRGPPPPPMPPPASPPPINPDDGEHAAEGSGTLGAAHIAVDILSSPALIVLSYDEEDSKSKGEIEP